MLLYYYKSSRYSYKFYTTQTDPVPVITTLKITHHPKTPHMQYVSFLQATKGFCPDDQYFAGGVQGHTHTMLSLFSTQNQGLALHYLQYVKSSERDGNPVIMS